MKKSFLFFILVILLIISPKFVYAVEGLVCLYHKQGSSIMYFQNEDATRGVRYISYKQGEKPDVLDELWHHDVDPFLSIDYRDYDSLDANGRYLSKCPKYAAIDSKFDEAIFDSTSYCERCSMSESFYIDYELYQQIDKGLDELLNEQHETIPENQKVLTCMYEGDKGRVVINQDSKGNLTVKYGKDCPNTALSIDSCFSDIPKDSAAIDVDKFETNTDILTEYKTLKKCPDRVAFYTDDFGIYHIELGVGTYTSYVPQNISPTPQQPYEDKINYNSLCENRSIKQTMKLIGYLVQVARWIVPLIIIVLGMIDFGKASIESDDKALNKATASLIRRIVAGVVVFFIPTIILGLLNAIEITKGIEDESNSQFGACTKCIFGAHKAGYCDISGGSTGGTGGDASGGGIHNTGGSNLEQTLK